VHFFEDIYGEDAALEKELALSGHLKTGHRRTLQNRPTEQKQNKSIYTS
jgi:hypothetical protein